MTTANDMVLPDGLMARAVFDTAQSGGINWSMFVANLMGGSPICSDTHLQCPFCGYREEFERGKGPQKFIALTVEDRFASYLTRVYRCPATLEENKNCRHTFAPIDAARFSAYHAAQPRIRAWRSTDA